MSWIFPHPKGVKMTYTICPEYETKNDLKEKYCLNCSQKLIEKEENKAT